MWTTYTTPHGAHTAGILETGVWLVVGYEVTTLMERRLERELMDDEEQAAAYARADFSVSNQLFAAALVTAAPRDLRNIVDLGCGPADVTIRIARVAAAARITAVDGSAPMLTIAARAVRAAALDDRVTLLRARLPGLPLRDDAFDAVLSKDLLHHLPDPFVLWREVARLGRPGAHVVVMDLLRPATPDAARRIVAAAAGDADAVLQTDFYNSLHAAFTLEDVRQQLAAVTLPLAVEQVSERHLLVSGRLG